MLFLTDLYKYACCVPIQASPDSSFFFFFCFDFVLLDTVHTVIIICIAVHVEMCSLFLLTLLNGSFHSFLFFRLWVFVVSIHSSVNCCCYCSFCLFPIRVGACVCVCAVWICSCIELILASLWETDTRHACEYEVYISILYARTHA